MFDEKFEQLEMNQLCVSAGVPIQVAVRDIRTYGNYELYHTNDFSGWHGLEADVQDYVIHVTTKGTVKIFGQDVIAYTLRDKEGNVTGFEVRL